MKGSILRDKNGEVLAPVSLYQPSDSVKIFTTQVKEDFETGSQIQSEAYAEFDMMSMLDIMDRDQKRFNLYVGPQSQDPDENWRFHGIRGGSRNKVIAMTARVVATMLYPEVFAQNDASEEDRDSAYVMRDLIEWNIKNSDYEMSFLYNVIAMLVNPVAYMNIEFVRSMQTIKEKLASGKVSTKEVVDEIMSGLQVNNVPADEMFIANAYEHDLQKQRFLVRRKFIEYDDAKAKYGDHDHFEHVSLGIRVLYSDDKGLFYDQKDDDLKTLVEEVVYLNRKDDTEAPFINGIYMGDTDVNANMMKHRRSTLSEQSEVIEVPIYPYVKGGFEPIDEKRFFFYKSLVSKMWWDDELINRMWQVGMDGSFLEAMKPIGISGEEEINSSVMIPGKVSVFNEDTKITPIAGNTSSGSAFNAVKMAQDALSEDSQDPILSGALPSQKQTATATMLAQQNARIQMGLFGRMIGQMVKDIGGLMIDVIVHHQTVADVEEISSDLKYPTFVLPNKTNEGRKVTEKIQFTEEMMSEYAPPKGVMEQRVLEEEGGIDGDIRIFKINPEKFAKLRFQIYIEPDKAVIRSKELEDAMKMEAYTLLVQNPLIATNPDNLEAVTRDFLVDPLTDGDSEKYLKKPQDGQTMQPAGQPTQKSNLPQQMTNQNKLTQLVNQ